MTLGSCYKTTYANPINLSLDTLLTSIINLFKKDLKWGQKMQDFDAYTANVAIQNLCGLIESPKVQFCITSHFLKAFG